MCVCVQYIHPWMCVLKRMDLDWGRKRKHRRWQLRASALSDLAWNLCAKSFSTVLSTSDLQETTGFWGIFGGFLFTTARNTLHSSTKKIVKCENHEENVDNYMQSCFQPSPGSCSHSLCFTYSCHGNSFRVGFRQEGGTRMFMLTSVHAWCYAITGWWWGSDACICKFILMKLCYVAFGITSVLVMSVTDIKRKNFLAKPGRQESRIDSDRSVLAKPKASWQMLTGKDWSEKEKRNASDNAFDSCINLCGKNR